MHIGIIGLGLIGGSIALDLKEQLGVTVYGCDNNKKHANLAKELHLVDELLSESEIISQCQVIICCIPVHYIIEKVEHLLNNISSDQIVIDTGSTKKEICEALRSHPNRNRFVAAHPLAGTEHSGPQAAIRGLFRGKKNIICDQDASDPEAVDTAKKVFRSLGMDTFILESNEHDRHLAYVSHLSHVSSFMLGLTVLDLEKDQTQISNLASTGFESTVRLAKSSPETWGAIFDKNSENVCEALAHYIMHLNHFLEVLKNNNKKEAIALMQRANNIKSVLEGIKT